MEPTNSDNDFNCNDNINIDLPDFLSDVDLGSSTLEAHLATPDVSYEEYRLQKEIECGNLVMARKSVYLDTRFWIHLRDSSLGKPVATVFNQILKELRKGVTEGKFICPFAADMLAEVYKQSDRTTRSATARLIDELSLNIALQPEPERLTTELYHGIRAVRSGKVPQDPLEKLVWTRSSFVIGHVAPTSTAFDASTELAIQKSFLDSISRLGFYHQVIGSYDKEFDNERFNNMWRNLAERLNKLNAENLIEDKSRKQIEVDEFSGALQAYLPIIQNVIQDMLIQDFESSLNTQEKAQTEKAALQIGGILCEAFRLGRLGSNFPTFAIRAGLASAVRWDRNRKYKPNDFHDFGHAAAALPYFDIFATEKSLCHLLVNDLKYDTRFNTVVEFDPEKVLARLTET